jgi:pachytene checkpoint protein 2
MDVADMITVNRLMPDEQYAGLWDSIVVDTGVKDRLLRSVALSLRLRTELPFETTALHGLALLYGPPGTGKTTLARGLAHQVAPLVKGHQARYLEVNPHGLMSAEHGQSQRKVSELLGEHIPALAEDRVPTVVLLDEVESMAVARSEASLAANPADVHRATDAVLAALDANTSTLPHVVIVATSNFTRALDDAFLSRADVAIEVPLPDAVAAKDILQATLRAMSTVYAPLAVLAKDSRLDEVARSLVGTDGRRIRKTITEAMLTRTDTVLDPGQLTLEDLVAGADRVKESADLQPPMPQGEEDE